LSREAMPHIREARGVILNIASDWGLVGGKDGVAYCAVLRTPTPLVEL